MEERGAALMEEEQMETVGRGTGGEESSSLLARTCLYRVSLEGGDVQLAIAGPAGNRGIRSSHRTDGRVAGGRGGMRDKRSQMLSALETGRETYFVFFFF